MAAVVTYWLTVFVVVSLETPPAQEQKFVVCYYFIKPVRYFFVRWDLSLALHFLQLAHMASTGLFCRAALLGCGTVARTHGGASTEKPGR